MIPTRFAVCGLSAALLVFSTGSGATPWQWRDAQGRMVYSDRAPPAEVPVSRIVRSPLPAPAAAGPSGNAASVKDAGAASDPANAPGAARTTATAASTAAAVPAAPAPASWVERERALRERQAEQAANETKAREEQERIAQAKRACDGLRENIRVLESGIRVASLNARGEAEPIDDAERTRRLKSARADLERHCAAG